MRGIRFTGPSQRFRFGGAPGGAWAPHGPPMGGPGQGGGGAAHPWGGAGDPWGSPGIPGDPQGSQGIPVDPRGSLGDQNITKIKSIHRKKTIPGPTSIKIYDPDLFFEPPGGQNPTKTIKNDDV